MARWQKLGHQPGYLAPEVIKGQRADRRSDLYDFGAVCVCWSFPFAATIEQLVDDRILAGGRRSYG